MKPDIKLTLYKKNHDHQNTIILYYLSDDKQWTCLIHFNGEGACRLYGLALQLLLR